MKKIILSALLCMALNAGAGPALEDITIVLNVRSCEGVRVSGAPAICAAPVVYNAPVIYTAPVVYQQPVVYNAPVVYNSAPASTVIINSGESYAPALGCGSYDDGSFLCSYGCASYCNPDLIRFGRIQAHREGYRFNYR